MNRTATPERRILYQLDHIGSVAAKPVEFLHQDDVTFLHLHSQQIQSFPVGRTAGCFVGKYATGFHPRLFKPLI
jgi:hypothetical protein